MCLRVLTFSVLLLPQASSVPGVLILPDLEGKYQDHLQFHSLSPQPNELKELLPILKKKPKR